MDQNYFLEVIIYFSVLVDVVGNDTGTNIINDIESNNVESFLTIPPNIVDVAPAQTPGKKEKDK